MRFNKRMRSLCDGFSLFIEKNQKFLIVLFSIIVLFLLVFLIGMCALQKNLNQNSFEKRVPISIIVGSSNTIFINAQTDAFYLGGGPPGSTITANFNITNIIGRTVLIKLSAEGSVKDWISFSENDFILKPNELKEIVLIAEIPENAFKGTYNDSFVVIKHYLK
ncbi:MAG: hypothetical protein ACP5OZ_01080 [Candidatus Woesearchaeota archaeon]